MSGQGTVPEGGDYQGQLSPYEPPNLVNSLDRMIRQIIAGKAFACLALVKSVTGGGIGKPPRVSVQPMVSQIDGANNQIPHGEIFDIPAFRLQGGNGAMILDPVVGEIGQAIICDRDTSNVKATGAPAGPGSFRQNDYADGCYFGGFLNEPPTQYVWIEAAGIHVVTPLVLTLAASNVTLDASGNLAVKGEVTAKAGTGSFVTLTQHLQAGEKPTPGT